MVSGVVYLYQKENIQVGITTGWVYKSGTSTTWNRGLVCRLPDELHSANKPTLANKVFPIVSQKFSFGIILFNISLVNRNSMLRVYLYMYTEGFLWYQYHKNTWSYGFLLLKQRTPLNLSLPRMQLLSSFHTFFPINKRRKEKNTSIENWPGRSYQEVQTMSGGEPEFSTMHSYLSIQ